MASGAQSLRKLGRISALRLPATVRLALAYARLVWKARAAYRWDFALRWLGYPLRLLMAYALWAHLARANPQLDIDFGQLMVYYIFALFLSDMFSFIRLARSLREEIYGGDIALYVVRPMPHAVMHYADVLASVGLTSLMASPLLIAVAFWVRGVWPGWAGIAWFVLFFAIGLTITYQIYYLFGLTTFFTDEIVGTLRMYHSIELFLGGALLPLSMFPPTLQAISRFLPFQFWVYLPARAISAPPDLPSGLASAALGLAWILGLGGLISLVWRAGWRHYSGHSL